MATLRVLRVIADGSNPQAEALTLQPKLDNVKKIGQPIVVNCPGKKNATAASKINFTGNDHSLALHNVVSSAVYKYSAPISPIQLNAKEVSLTPKPFSNVVLKIVYAVDSNIAALTLDYLGILVNLVSAFIQGIAIATAQYFTSLSVLILNPIARLLGLKKPSEIDNLIDEIDNQRVGVLEKTDQSSEESSDESES
jgi:hypothetical protein